MQIIALNVAIMNEVKALIIRAGEHVFRLPTREELETLLKGLLGDAMSAEGIPNIEALSFPAPDPVKAARIRLENPDEIQAEGQTLNVTYSHSYGTFYVKAAATVEQLAFLTKIPTLPSGRQVTLVVTYEGQTFEGKDLEGLRAKIEARRIEKAWEAARAQHATDWQSDLQKTLERLSSVLKKVEVTTDANGEPVEAFIALQQYDASGSYFKLGLESEAEARSKTQTALQALVRRLLKDAIAIPDEEPFKTRPSSWYSWSLTELGQGLQARFEHIVNEATTVEGLTIETVMSRVETAKAKAQTARSEIGGRFIEVRDKVVAVETSYKEVYAAIDYYDRNLVKTETEALEAELKVAREKLAAAEYDEVETLVAALASRIEALKVEVETKKAEKTQAKERKQQLESYLYDIRRGRGEYAEVTTAEQAEAERFSNELDRLVDSEGDYKQALVVAVETQDFINRIDSRIAAWRELENKLAEFLLPDYKDNGWFEVDCIRFGSNHWLYSNEQGFDALMDALLELPEDKETMTVMETELGNTWLVRLEARRYGRNEISFTFTLNREVVVTESDFEKTKTVDLFEEPDETELTNRQQIRRLEKQLELMQAESQRYGRWLVKFEADQRPEFRGRLTGTVTVEGGVSIKLPRQDEYTTVEGVVRVTCDPQRCNWLDVPPVVGESWYCTYKDFAIGRDKQGRLVVPVNPQTKLVDPATILAEIERLQRGEVTTEAETLSPTTEQVETPKPEVVEVSEDFLVLGDGWVRCIPCNYSIEAMKKKEWKALVAGAQVPVTCSNCGRTGHVEK